MKPDKYFTIEELVTCWTAWDITEDDLLKYGDEGTLRFLISKRFLEHNRPEGSGAITFYCTSLSEIDKQYPCPSAENQSFFDLAQETVGRLRNPTTRRSKITLLQNSNNCQHCGSANLRQLRPSVYCSQYFFNHYYEPILNDDGVDIGDSLLDDFFCRKEDLLVSREEKERFEYDHLQDALLQPSIAKENTFLRAIGAMLITFCNKPPYLNGTSGEFIVSAIADNIERELSNNDLSDKGISNRKLRELIPKAAEMIRQNKIN